MASVLQYATAAEFDEFQLPSTALKGVPTTTKDRALQWGSRIALSYIRKRKTPPLLTWGEDLRANICELAAYYLVGRKGYSPGSGNNQVIRMSYEDAIAWLRDVSRGIVEMVDCQDSRTDVTTDDAGTLASSDTIVNWNFQTRARGCTRGGFGGGDGLG